MSDPVSNAEVEDVLASIRRLVSEETRLLLEDGSAASSDAGKLVLTPSLRVNPPAQTEENGPLQQGDVVEPPAPEVSEDTGNSDQNEQNQRAAENARMAAHLVQALNEGSQIDLNSAPFSRSDFDAGPSTTLDDTEREDRLLSEDVPSMAFRAPDDLSTKIAALEAAVARHEGDWEPDGVAETEPYSGTEAPAMTWAEEIADADMSGARQAEEDHNITTLPISPTKQTELSVAQEQSRGEADGDAFAQLTENDRLRDAVAEIVREELQGVLGERITRSVRKLVRAEIQRALAARDLL